MPERGQSNGKLARAIRARLAAKRKTLRRISGIVRTEFKDRTKVVYVPVDVATGKVLDPAFQPAPLQPPTSRSSANADDPQPPDEGTKTMAEEIHDMSRVDCFMASRRRAMFFHSVWKPMLAGAVGAAIMTRGGDRQRVGDPAQDQHPRGGRRARHPEGCAVRQPRPAGEAVRQLCPARQAVRPAGGEATSLRPVRPRSHPDDAPQASAEKKFSQPGLCQGRDQGAHHPHA